MKGPTGYAVHLGERIASRDRHLGNAQDSILQPDGKLLGARRDVLDCHSDSFSSLGLLSGVGYVGDRSAVFAVRAGASGDITLKEGEQRTSLLPGLFRRAACTILTAVYWELLLHAAR